MPDLLLLFQYIVWECQEKGWFKDVSSFSDQNNLPYPIQVEVNYALRGLALAIKSISGVKCTMQVGPNNYFTLVNFFFAKAGFMLSLIIYKLDI